MPTISKMCVHRLAGLGVDCPKLLFGRDRVGRINHADIPNANDESVLTNFFRSSASFPNAP